jgi:hypothetical protein
MTAGECASRRLAGRSAQHGPSSAEEDENPSVAED